MAKYSKVLYENTENEIGQSIDQNVLKNNIVSPGTKLVIQFKREYFWKYDDNWTFERLLETENRKLWKERTLYTGQKRIISESISYKHKKISDGTFVWTESRNPKKGFIYANEKNIQRIIKYENLDKWVTSKNGLGEYIYNISVAPQYKYAYRYYNKVYFGKPFMVNDDYDCKANDCEEIFCDFEKYTCGIHDICKISEIKKELDYKYYSNPWFRNIIDSYDNMAFMYPLVILCERSFTNDDDIELIKKIYSKYIEKSFKFERESPLIIVGIQFSVKVLAYIAKLGVVIPLACSNSDAMYELSTYIGCTYKKEDDYEIINLSTLNFLFIIKNEIRFVMEIGTEKRISNAIELLKKQIEVEEDPVIIGRLNDRIKSLNNLLKLPT